MINLNHIEVIGNLTRDPELRFTPTNQAVASFAVATNRRYKDQSGNWVDSPPEYHEVVVWGQLGERCNQVLHKGERIFVAGRLQTRSWEAQDGSKKYKTEIIVDTIIGPDLVNKNLGSGDGLSAGGSYGGSEEQSSGPSSTPSSQPSAPRASSKQASAPSPDDVINIDDIPF
jgi:single-strand DNA-binding protein